MPKPVDRIAQRTTNHHTKRYRQQSVLSFTQPNHQETRYSRGKGRESRLDPCGIAAEKAETNATVPDQNKIEEARYFNDARGGHHLIQDIPLRQLIGCDDEYRDTDPKSEQRDSVLLRRRA